MKNRKVIIHVGLQKTASTYFQKQVFRRIKRNNIIYIGRPYTIDNFAFNCLQYADNSLYDVSAMREEIEFIEKEMGRGNNKPLLISDELFSGNAFYNFINRGMIAKIFSEVFPDAEIILFIRGQVDLIESLYNQYVKIGRIDDNLDGSFLHRPGQGFPLEKWIKGERNWKHKPKNRFINHRSLFTPEHFRYSKLYSLYRELFNKVHVFLYEDVQNDPKAFLVRLGAVLSAELSSDFAIDKKEQKRIVNARLCPKQLQATLVQNKIAKILPVIKTTYGKAFFSKISPFFPDKEERNRAYIISLLKDSDIFGDNYLLNQKAILGMERFPKQYFGDSA